MYIVLQFLEGNVLVPIVMKNTIGLSPFFVLVVLLIGAAVAGIVGAFLAVPVAAAVEVVLERLQAREVPVAQEPGRRRRRPASQSPMTRVRRCRSASPARRGVDKRRLVSEGSRSISAGGSDFGFALPTWPGDEEFVRGARPPSHQCVMRSRSTSARRNEQAFDLPERPALLGYVDPVEVRGQVAGLCRCQADHPKALVGASDGAPRALGGGHPAIEPGFVDVAGGHRSDFAPLAGTFRAVRRFTLVEWTMRMRRRFPLADCRAVA